MIVGIGTDLVAVSRIQRSLEKGDGFKELVYSKTEVFYCERANGRFQSYAGRFAAKEAFLKALGTGWRGEMAFHEIEVINDDMGKPCIYLSGKTLEEFNKIPGRKTHLSISHTSEEAVAFVIIEKEN